MKIICFWITFLKDTTSVILFIDNMNQPAHNQQTIIRVSNYKHFSMHFYSMVWFYSMVLVCIPDNFDHLDLYSLTIECPCTVYLVVKLVHWKWGHTGCDSICDPLTFTFISHFVLVAPESITGDFTKSLYNSMNSAQNRISHTAVFYEELTLMTVAQIQIVSFLHSIPLEFSYNSQGKFVWLCACVS